MFAGAKFNLVQNGDSPNRYIWLHGDEQTARMALEYHIGLYNGLAFFIESETREIPFKSTIVDPNRIFSRDGAYYALRKFKPGWQPGTLKMALDEIDRERLIESSFILFAWSLGECRFRPLCGLSKMLNMTTRPRECSGKAP